MTTTTTMASVDPWLLAAAVVALTTVAGFFLLTNNASGGSKLPPGPPSGYLGKGRFDMPAEPYKRFAELAKKYGVLSVFHCPCSAVVMIFMPFRSSFLFQAGPHTRPR